MKTFDIPHVILYALALVVGTFLVYTGKVPAAMVYPVLAAWLVTPSAGAAVLRVMAGGGDDSGSTAGSSGAGAGAAPKPPTLLRTVGPFWGVWGARAETLIFALTCLDVVAIGACATLTKDAKTAEAEAPVVVADVDSEVARLNALVAALRVMLPDGGGLNKAAIELTKLRGALDELSSAIPVYDAGVTR